MVWMQHSHYVWMVAIQSPDGRGIVWGEGMTQIVTVGMPVHLPTEFLEAVRKNELTRCDDADEMHKRIGWLICAYAVLIEAQCDEPRYD